MLFGREDYRKIWEEHHGVKIPKGLEIHHIDGNHSNNDIHNLMLVTIEEHKEIHEAQGDWGAVQAILMRMDCRDGISEAASNAQRKLLEEGRHNFQKIDPERRSKISKQTHYNRSVAFLGIEDTSANSANARKHVKPENAKRQLDDIHDLVRGTKWWYNPATKKHKRAKTSPGPEYIQGFRTCK